MQYTESQILVLEGIDAIRLRPGMYVGGTDKNALHHLIWEVVNNSLDEHLAGFGKELLVTLHKDGSLSVQDYGRGIPLGIHPQTGKSTLETILTIPHAGGKFRDSLYKIAGGLHGVGITAVNALSSRLTAIVQRDGMRVTHIYEKGKLLHTEAVDATTVDTGTYIRFLPDESIFHHAQFSPDVIKSRLRQYAFLTPKFKIAFCNEIDGTEIPYYYERGLLDYIEYLQKGSDPLHDPWYLEGEKDGIQMRLLLQYNDSYNTQILSFVNLISTKEGGTHETGMKIALTRTLNDISKANGWLKENLTGDEWLEGLTGILSVFVPNPEFEGQTKNKLSNSEIRGILASLVQEKLSELLQEHPLQVKKIAEKALLAKRARDAAKKARELIRNPRKKDYSHLTSGKYAPCTTKNPAKNELYIVEGDSAGGSAKQGRDRTFQSILSLKGKPLNVEKARLDRVLSNEEIRSIITAIGTGIQDDFDLSKAKYQKIILMTDADVDGSHIRVLLLTFFFRYMPRLIEEGYVYIAQPPLYKLETSRQTVYVYSDQEKDQSLKKMKNARVQRYKGLGEMNPDQLWETTMDPERRVLLQVTLDDALESDAWFGVFMGSAVEKRKEYLSKNL